MHIVGIGDTARLQQDMVLARPIAQVNLLAVSNSGSRSCILPRPDAHSFRLSSCSLSCWNSSPSFLSAYIPQCNAAVFFHPTPTPRCCRPLFPLYPQTVALRCHVCPPVQRLQRYALHHYNVNAVSALDASANAVFGALLFLLSITGPCGVREMRCKKSVRVMTR